MGAGVIPLAVENGELLFLFQKSFTGRKVGYLIDFGGGLNAGESYREAAVREFVEESEGLYLNSQQLQDQASEAADSVQLDIGQQIREVDGIFEQTLSLYPHWWCRRSTVNPKKPKQWRTYFIQFPYHELAPLNRLWASDRRGRFKKRRELIWLSAEELLRLYAEAPEKLWKRVRQLDGAEALIHEIQTELIKRC